MNKDQKLACILEGWLEGGLDENEQQNLLNDLEKDSELRREFAAQVAMLGALKTTTEPEPRWLALFDLLQSTGTQKNTQGDLEEQTMARISKLTDVPWYRRFPIIQSVAALLLLCLAWISFQNLNPTKAEKTGSEEIVVSPQPIAIVLGLDEKDSSLATGDYLQPGPLAQTEGWLSIQTMNGVNITMGAPFDVKLISPEEIKVDNGHVRVRVPPGAEGFRMTSRNFEIIDLGTEFAAEVRPDGTGRCRVFEGAADVSLIDSFGQPNRTRRLQANNSAKIDPSFQRVSLINEEDASYPEMMFPTRETLALADSYPSNVMQMKPSHYWRFESADNGLIANEVTNARPLAVIGSAQVTPETGANHSGQMTQAKNAGFFTLNGVKTELLNRDFTISFFAQFDWLQNYAMVSVQQYDNKHKGHAFVLQSFASFKRSGLRGTGLHAAFRNPPGWIGGTEIFGRSLLRPNHWHHIAIVRDSERATLFLDGLPVGHERIGDMKLDFKNLYIGRLNGNLGQSPEFARGMVGHLDEMAIFQRALTKSEIQTLSVRARSEN
jgi:hypothetical protein